MMNNAERIVAILLEGNRVCAGCEKEFRLNSPPGTSHGFCRRHFMEMYADMFTPEEIAAMPDQDFAPDASQQQRQ